MSSFLHVPADVIRLFSQYLEPYDLLTLSLTCKECYRVLRALPHLKNKVCYPFTTALKHYKLTLEQCQTLSRMLSPKASMFKICRAPSGHGKTWLMAALACYKYLRYDEQSSVIFVTSSATVSAFITFWLQNIGILAITNCQRCTLYHPNWRVKMLTSRVMITTFQICHEAIMAMSATGKPYAIYAKLPAKTNINVDKYESVRLLEFALFTSVEAKTPRKDFSEFFLSNSTMEVSILRPVFESYPHVGFEQESVEQATLILKSLTHNLDDSNAMRIITMLSRHQ